MGTSIGVDSLCACGGGRDIRLHVASTTAVGDRASRPGDGAGNESLLARPAFGVLGNVSNLAAGDQRLHADVVCESRVVGSVPGRRQRRHGESDQSAGGRGSVHGRFPPDFSPGVRATIGRTLGTWYRIEGSYFGSYSWDDTAYDVDADAIDRLRVDPAQRRTEPASPGTDAPRGIRSLIPGGWPLFGH